MSTAGRSRLRRALEHAAHSGFPWAMGGGEGHSLALRRAIRRSVVGHWPPRFRLAGQILMVLLWPLESLRDAVVFALQVDRAVLGGRSRLAVAWRAWAAALGYNLPPIDYLAYRLFEPGRPGPGHWLHSADAHLHFSALAAPEVRALVEDKLAFADLGESVGVAVMPVLAVYGADRPVRPFADGAPPPQDLLVKPRRGHRSWGQMIWRWQGDRHVAAGPVPEPDLATWLAGTARTGDLLVQALAKPPDHLGPVAPSRAPVVSIVTAERPNRRRSVAFALAAMAVEEDGAEVGFGREIDLATGRVLPASPGALTPVWGEKPDRHKFEAFPIPGWQDILVQVDRFHAALPGPAPVLKWDFILTDQGPRLLETNTGTGIYSLQAMTLCPITETPLGAALEAWAR
ncbi:MAG: sugar-transfer associated ATP-grasp domain-containing protein [Paracoccaceae bacterium]